jgi:predicted ribosomally synthesized peptide with SipW-like signal peptide
MTDKNLDLTRRKVLGSIGAVGVAGAAAGYGTTAYFNDTESVENNTLTAGSLDLKVDWEEHYNYPQLLGLGDPTENLVYDPVTDLDEIPDETVASDWKPFPPGTGTTDDTREPLLFVYDGNESETTDVDQYMTDTAIEGYPDSDNNGTAEFPVEAMLPDERPCDVLADVPEDYGTYTTFDGEELVTLGRTDNEDTRLDDGSPAPLISLEDVKPGDFGEITFSTHLCHNPGYLWMRMPGGLDLDENGLSEPESESEQEQEGTVELADEIQTTIWYDNNCNNLIDTEEKLDIMAIADTSDSIDGSLSEDGSELDTLRDAANVFVDFLPEEEVNGEQRIRAGLLTMNGPGDSGGEGVRDQPALRKGLGPLSQFDTDSDGDANVGDFMPEVGQGSTPMPYCLDLARKVLNDQGRSDARQVILLVTDGLPDYVGAGDATLPYIVEDPDTGATYTSDEYDGSINGISTCTELDETQGVADDIKGSGIDILGVGIALGSTDCDEGDGNIGGDTFMECYVAGVAATPDTCEPDQFFDAANYDNLESVALDVGEQLVGGDGTGDRIIFQGTLREAEGVLTDGDGVPLDADRDAEGRQCFEISNTHCFGFSWWLPPDVGNHVQTDSARFDLGFYAEQCRHNGGEEA